LHNSETALRQFCHTDLAEGRLLAGGFQHIVMNVRIVNTTILRRLAVQCMNVVIVTPLPPLIFEILSGTPMGGPTLLCPMVDRMQGTVSPVHGGRR
jgi:hypothetical protein